MYEYICNVKKNVNLSNLHWWFKCLKQMSNNRTLDFYIHASFTVCQWESGRNIMHIQQTSMRKANKLTFLPMTRQYAVFLSRKRISRSMKVSLFVLTWNLSLVQSTPDTLKKWNLILLNTVKNFVWFIYFLKVIYFH